MCSLDKDGKCHSYFIGTNGQKMSGSPGYVSARAYSGSGTIYSSRRMYG